MSKRTFITFGVLVFVLAVVIPWLVFRSQRRRQRPARRRSRRT